MPVVCSFYLTMHGHPHQQTCSPEHCLQTRLLASNPHPSIVSCRNAAGLRGVDVVILGPVFRSLLTRRAASTHPVHPAETRQQRHAMPRARGAGRVHAA